MKFFAVLGIFLFAAVASADLHPGIAFPEYTFQPDPSRIIQGWPAAEGQFPHQVNIRGTVSGGWLSCGGTLISASWVLTAAHCIVGINTVIVRLGSVNVNTPALIIETPDFRPHPQYNSNNLNNDIGLVNLRQNVIFNDRIRAIALPRQAQMNDPFVGRVATASGWGFTANNGPLSTTMNYVNLTVITNAQCAGVYGSGVVIASTICCVGINSPAQSTCSGDSGGSLMLRDTAENIDIQVGVVSFVSSLGCSSGNPSGYVRPQFFWPWINQNTGIPIRP